MKETKQTTRRATEQTEAYSGRCGETELEVEAEAEGASLLLLLLCWGVGWWVPSNTRI